MKIINFAMVWEFSMQVCRLGQKKGMGGGCVGYGLSSDITFVGCKSALITELLRGRQNGCYHRDLLNFKLRRRDHDIRHNTKCMEIDFLSKTKVTKTWSVWIWILIFLMNGIGSIWETVMFQMSTVSYRERTTKLTRVPQSSPFSRILVYPV